MSMKFKLFAVLFALVFSMGIISHETSHYELDHGDHDHADHSDHSDHSVELSEDCSTCLVEQSEFVQEETTHQPSATISDFLVVKKTRLIHLLPNQLSIRAPPRN